jgi:hypothetical protein
MAETLWKLSRRFKAYAGQDVEDVPDSYLTWLETQDWFHKDFPKEASILRKELEYRDQFNLHIRSQKEEEWN